jgi:hypothetical protein
MKTPEDRARELFTLHSPNTEKGKGRTEIAHVICLTQETLVEIITEERSNSRISALKEAAEICNNNKHSCPENIEGECKTYCHAGDASAILELITRGRHYE